MTRGRIIGLTAIVGIVVVLMQATDQAAWRIIVAVVVAAAVMRLGYAMISGLAQPPVQPPDEGTLRKVKLTYRCSICGAEVHMTAAASEDPEPPRHCMENMELVAPIA
ncbi:MAG: hypothetical protein IT195_00530 [Microthrixaceae bacterium]|nr:hypothetical protein [Microthrixaceae bacterium]